MATERRPNASRSLKTRLEGFLLSVVDGGLVGIVFLLPLMLGGRHPWGHLLLSCLAVAIALAWVGRQWLLGDLTWRPLPGVVILIAGAAVVLLQCLSLPEVILRWLAPNHATLLPLWNHGGLGPWPCISVMPEQTRAGLAIFLSYGLLFVVTAQRVQAIEDVERLLRWCAASAVCMALLGLAQFFAGNGKFVWFYEYPYGDAASTVKGSFTNRNHFAHFLALGVGPLIWWLQDTARAKRRRHHDREELKTYLFAIALVIVVFASLTSLSRGGIAAMVLAIAIGAAVSYRAKAISGKLLSAIVFAGVFMSASLAIFGYDLVANRFSSVSSGSIEKLDEGAGRRTIWSAALASVPKHALLGAGIGTFQQVYPAYADVKVGDGLEFTHAECGLLQIALETGCVGLSLALAAIAVSGWWCWRGLSSTVPQRLRLCAGATTAAMAVSVPHSLVDFVWYVPACMAMTVILVACGLRIAQLSEPSHAVNQPIRMPKFALPAALVAILLLGGWSIATLVPPASAAPAWDHYRLAVNAIEASIEAAPPGKNPLAAATDEESERSLIADLEEVVARQPTHANAHLELAEAHLRLFERLQRGSDNSMSAVNIRDAALKSHFPSQEALRAWLARALGDRLVHLDAALQHARCAVQLCPLLGRGYVYLAKLSFMDQQREILPAQYVEQALRARPFDGSVRYHAAGEACLAGDMEKWLEHAYRAYHSGRRQQRQIMSDLLAQSSNSSAPQTIDFILTRFQPDLQGLRLLYWLCKDRCSQDGLASLVRCWAERASADASAAKGEQAAALWLEAQGLYAQLHNDEQSLCCLQNAVQSDPGDYNAHYQLGLLLLKQRSFEVAEQHLRWCFQRRPHDAAVEASLRDALKGRLR